MVKDYRRDEKRMDDEYKKDSKVIAGVTILSAAGLAALTIFGYKKYIKETKENLKKLSNLELTSSLIAATTIGNTKVAKLIKEEMESRKKSRKKDK